MKKNQETTSRRKAVDVGEYISKGLFHALQKTYHTAFPNTIASFRISKTLILNVLNSSTKVSGIRFMYGLSDVLNPNSIRVFLIPCINEKEYSLNSKPLLVEKGYYDQEGNVFSLPEMAQMMADYVKYVHQQDETLNYKTITRGNFFGRNSLENFMSAETCVSISYHLGLRKNIIAPIIEPLDRQGYAYADVYMDFTRPCPPVCKGHDGSEHCMATTAVEQFSEEAELDFYRAFRDTYLLDQEGGAMLYEMYYFISPLVNMLMLKKADDEVIYHNLYFNKILPFKALLEQKNYQAATYLLQEVLEELTNKYTTELI